MWSQTENPFGREIETFLRRRLLQRTYFRGDLYLEPYYPLRRPIEIGSQEIRETLPACKRNNTVCEFVLKDISTIGHKLDNLIIWEQTARRTINEFG